MSIPKVPDPPVPKTVTTKVTSVKLKAKQPKAKAEPPPKKRKTWKEELPSTPRLQSDEEGKRPYDRRNYEDLYNFHCCILTCISHIV